MTKPDDDETLIKFYEKTNPGGPGWKRIKNISKLRSKSEEKEWIVPRGILCMILGCFAIYSALFSTGYFIYGELSNGCIFLISTIIFSIILFKISKKILSNE